MVPPFFRSMPELSATFSRTICHLFLNQTPPFPELNATLKINYFYIFARAKIRVSRRETLKKYIQNSYKYARTHTRARPREERLKRWHVMLRYCKIAPFLLPLLLSRTKIQSERGDTDEIEGH